jgi:hypothetical protein
MLHEYCNADFRDLLRVEDLGFAFFFCWFDYFRMEGEGPRVTKKNLD